MMLFAIGTKPARDAAIRMLGVCAVAVAIGPGMAFAADPVASDVRPLLQNQSLISELRVGAFAHDPWSPESGSVNINAEVLFSKPYLPVNPVWRVLVPRPHLGATVNTVGKTSNAYAGLTWSLDVTDKLFVEASFGGAVNTGKTGFVVPADRVAMGCNWSFRESASVGYRLAQNWSVMATVEHFSNAGLCKQNRGLTNVGARIAYTF